MKIVVVGLGYVGTVCAACLARDGFEVVGVDVNPAKVRTMQSGRSPIMEPGLTELVKEGTERGRLRAAEKLDVASSQADVFMISVGTPSARNGAADLTYLLRALRQVAEAIRENEKFQVVCVRSTVPPGTMREQVIPLLQELTGRSIGSQLGVAMNPEFLREGSSIRDYDSAPFDICGTSDKISAELVAKVYAKRNRPFHATSLETAELVKYVNNGFHALKVAFANEIGRLAPRLGVDSLEVMRMLCQDRRLNISEAYLRPGMAFGGSCLPKDLRSLVHEAKRSDVAVPLLQAILASNEVHLEAAIQKILSYGRPRTAILGLSFKSGTDDLRESAMVRLVESLLGKGVPVRIYDQYVRLSALVGANRAYIEEEIPHIGALLVETLEESIRDADIVVVGSDDAEINRVPGLLREEQTLIDLVGKLAGSGAVKPEGICW